MVSTGHSENPRLLVTLGDVAGIGPEILVKAWASGALHAQATPMVVGDAATLRRAVKLFRSDLPIIELSEPDFTRSQPNAITCLQATTQRLDLLPLGQVHAAAGRAAYEFLCAAIDATLAGQADAIVTLPLHKEALHAAGIPHPGHTEILAEQTGVTRYGMMLYASNPPSDGLAVIHVTLHMALRDVFNHLRSDAVLEKILLIEAFMRRMLGRPPRVGVCGLNPHASDGGLFGDEEARVIQPAVEQAQAQGIDATGPWPSDTLFVRGFRGAFDAIVAMYHDQGHIAFKLMAGWRAINVSVGLPIIRTSVAHGTAYDIAGKGIADPASLVEACRVAAQLTHCPSAPVQG